jgi:hypothetical protein
VGGWVFRGGGGRGLASTLVWVVVAGTLVGCVTLVAHGSCPVLPWLTARGPCCCEPSRKRARRSHESDLGSWAGPVLRALGELVAEVVVAGVAVAVAVAVAAALPSARTTVSRLLHLGLLGAL